MNLIYGEAGLPALFFIFQFGSASCFTSASHCLLHTAARTGSRILAARHQSEIGNCSKYQVLGCCLQRYISWPANKQSLSAARRPNGKKYPGEIHLCEKSEKTSL